MIIMNKLQIIKPTNCQNFELESRQHTNYLTLRHQSRKQSDIWPAHPDPLKFRGLRYNKSKRLILLGRKSRSKSGRNLNFVVFLYSFLLFILRELRKYISKVLNIFFFAKYTSIILFLLQEDARKQQLICNKHIYLKIFICSEVAAH